MFGILYRTLGVSKLPSGFIASKPTSKLGFLTVSFSSSPNQNFEEHSFTVSYLINSCGLSTEAAIVASRKVKLRNPEKPGSVLAFLREHEFSDTQISNFIRKRPYLLLSNPNKFFLPKFEFFYTKGLSKQDLVRVLSSDPSLLHRSLNRYIIPTYNLLKSVMSDDKKVVSALRNHWVSLQKHPKRVTSNIGLLKDLGFNDSSISSFLQHFTVILVLKPEKLRKLVNEVKDMGLDPRKYTFLPALRLFARKGRESKWNQSYKVYKKWGWSEDDILNAFRMHPNCMALSEKKISKAMDFLVNKMGWPSEKVARCPVILFYSFEKRILPRCMVVQILLLKGLMTKQEVKYVGMLTCVEKSFLDRYVTNYLEEIPQLLSVYQGNVDVKDVIRMSLSPRENGKK